jgi:uncharacterized protein DUF3667
VSRALVSLSECPNCGEEVRGGFCPRCGQKNGPLDPSVHDFLHDLSHELLHIDGKIFRSVQWLLTRPGFMTREYFEGRRARYISPIRLYLLASLLFFSVNVAGDFKNVQYDVKDQEELAAAPEAVTRVITMSEEERRHRLEEAFHWMPRLMFVLVPVFAVLVKIVTRSTGRHYPQHLYFALHTHAAVFTLAAVSELVDWTGQKILSDTAGLILLVYGIWYLVVAFRTAYGGSTRRAIGRAAFVSVAYGITALTTFGLLVMTALMWR